jgi:hypothetical protein
MTWVYVDSSPGLLGCDILYCCCRIPTFRTLWTHIKHTHTLTRAFLIQLWSVRYHIITYSPTKKQINRQTPWSGVLLGRLTVARRVRQFPHLLWGPKDQCRVRRGPPLVPMLGQMNPVHTFLPHFPGIRSSNFSEFAFQESQFTDYAFPCAVRTLVT